MFKRIIIILICILCLVGCSGSKTHKESSPKDELINNIKDIKDQYDDIKEQVEDVKNEIKEIFDDGDKEENVIEEPEVKEQQEEPQQEESNVIRTSVKEAIDAYEAFVDEYCEFMKKYNESEEPDFSLIMSYTSYMAKLADLDEKLEKMEDDLNDAETMYYVEVLNRCSVKILKSIQ